ncbi:MAG: hypothetical protein SGJ20_22155 [Planctomycetota bacterium]|nr:hypothetical protein [Planctomycetota bacterium]
MQSESPPSALPNDPPPVVRPRRWWGASNGRPPGLLTPRRMRLFFFLAILFGLSALFFWLVFRPLIHPRSELVFSTGGEYRALRAPPIPFVLEDYSALAPLSAALVPHGQELGPRILNVLNSPTAMDGLLQELPTGDANGSTVLIAYFAAHGVSDDGVPYLLCRNFDPANPDAGRYRIDDLLAQFKASSAAVKFIVLDSGRIECDPRLGMIINEFPRLLQEAVESANDPSLWVMVSNSTFERSYNSPSLQQSIFAHFVARGLKGAADLDQNRSVEVHELAKYVITNVSSWVIETTDSLTTQTPQMFWGGGPVENSPSPLLLSVAMFEREPEDTPPGIAAGSGEASLNDTAAASSAARPEAAAPEPPSARFSGVRGLAADSFETVANEEATPRSLVAQKKRDVRNKSVAKVKDPKKKGPTLVADDSAAAPGDAAPATTPAAEGAATVPGEEKGAAKAIAPTDKTAATDSQPTDATAKANTTGVAKSDKPTSDDGKSTDAKKSNAVVEPNPIDSDRPAEAVPALIVEGWKLRDRLLRRSNDLPVPIDFAPQVWAEYEAWLLDMEQQYRAGGIAPLGSMDEWLREAVLPLRDWRTPGPPPKVNRTASSLQRDYAARLRGRLPSAPAAVDQPYSLALAETLEIRGRATVDAELRKAITQYDRFVRGGSRGEFDLWIAKLPTELDSYLELRFARQLSQISALDWATVQLALETCRLGEQLAASRPALLMWIADQVDAADRMRWEAERRLLDQIDRQRHTTAVFSLREALAGYRQALENLATVEAAIDLRNDLLRKAPYYLQWHFNAGLTPDRVAPRYADLFELLNGISTLDQLLLSQDTNQLPEISRQLGEMEILGQRIDMLMQPSVINSLALLPASPGDSWRMSLMLETPLLDAVARIRILETMARIDGRLVSELAPRKLPSTIPPPRARVVLDWQRFLRRSELQVRLLGISSRQTDDSQVAYAAVQRAFEVVRDRSPNSDLPLDESAEAALFEAYRELGSAVQRFMSQSPSRMESRLQQLTIDTEAEPRPELLCKLDWLKLNFRLLDPRDVRRTENIRPESITADAEFYDLLLWNRRRLQRATEDAPPDDAVYFADVARAYRDQAAQLSNQPPIDLETKTQLEITGDTALDFTTVRERTLDLTLLLRDGIEPLPAWLLVDYDPSLLEVQLPAGVQLYDQNTVGNSKLRLASGNSAPPSAKQYPTRPEQLEWPASLTLQPGKPVPLRLKIRGKSNSPAPTQLIVKLVTGSSYIRHQTAVTLPLPESVELAVQGIAGSYAPIDAGIMLHTFPNRATQYVLGLSNKTNVDRVVDIELLNPAKVPAIDLPLSAVSAGEIATLLDRFGPTVSLASLKSIRVEAGGELVPLPFPLPEGAKPPAPAEPVELGKAAAPPPPDPKKPPPIPLPNGMLAVLTDRQTGLQTLRRIEIAPQRPRRFVQARVGYNVDRQQLQVQVTPQDRSIIPPEGVRVRCELIGPLQRGVKSQLEGEMKAPSYEANLFSNLPPDAGQVTLLIHIDDYPRAFVYDVPLTMSSVDLPESDYRGVKVITPPQGKSFVAPVRSIPVELQIDAPGVDPLSGQGEIEVGIDSDRDRELRDETSLMLSSDRQANVFLDGLMPGGKMTIETKVTDYKLDLPTPALTNAKVEILGRIASPDRTVWSEPVEILLDGTPPAIRRIELNPPGTLVVGEKLEAKVLAGDELSGVAKVEVALDATGEGKFTDEMKPLPAKLDAAGRWVAAPPTAELTPGTYGVLARATDSVGNTSEATVAKFRVVEPGAEGEKLGSVTGSVSYGGKPFADIEITLEGPPTAPAATPPAADAKPPTPVPGPTKTDASGAFRFERVPPGAYKVKASGVVRNKKRTAEAEAKVEPEPANGARVKLELK